jgi:galactofuranosylgalactofuranosylrhamnosyl-N-acetylglucosaminyl-diphospho-decaprenol beta-1,5/1,6-galactofuranosyltransferase
MLESYRARQSTYHLILDDDVKIEPESILRAVAFADHCARPTAVGGHMLSLTQRDHLHSWGEKVNADDVWWTSVLNQPYGSNFGAYPLRIDGLLHRRIDVDYNGWWMELIPLSILPKIGLSLPFFIKWDDAEWGLRAKAAGVTTVTLPGVACWHIPWTEKIDGVDWQAYYQARNRIITGLLHANLIAGGKLLDVTYASTIRHLLCQQYSTARLRNDALEAVLSGPTHLKKELPFKLAEIRAVRKAYSDSHILGESSDIPVVLPGHRTRVPFAQKKVKGATKRQLGWIMRLFSETVPVKPGAITHPQARLTWRQVTPARMATLDSALVTTPDGTGLTIYRRDPNTFKHEFKRARHLKRALQHNWEQLQIEYRKQAKQDSSIETWTELLNAPIQPGKTNEGEQ